MRVKGDDGVAVPLMMSETIWTGKLEGFFVRALATATVPHR